MIKRKFIDNSKNTGVYKITNVINSKIYIGSALFLHKRKNQHFHLLRINSHHSKYLQNAVNKYGINNFKFEIIEYCKKEELLNKEQYYIDNLKPSYNIRTVAHSQLGCKHTPETILKMKESSKKISPETRRYILDCRNKKIQKAMIQYDLNMNFIREWSSLKEYGTITGKSVGNICSVLKGRIKTSGGYIFKYKNND